MTIKPGLTNENFWNRMEQKFPKAVEKFDSWSREYKKAVDWDTLFNECYIAVNGENLVKKPAPKFHELPLAMQMGIWLEYLLQQEDCKNLVANFYPHDFRKSIEAVLYSNEMNLTPANTTV